MHRLKNIFRLKLLPLAIACVFPVPGLGKITLQNPLEKSWQCQAKDGQWQCLEVGDNTRNLFRQNVLPKEKTEVIANALNWVPSNDPANICGGYYYQYPLVQNPSKAPAIQFQQSSYSPDGTLTAEGTVEVKKGNQYLSADKAVLNKTAHSDKFNKIRLSGNVNLSQPGQLAISQSGTANITENTAVLNDAYYLIRVREKQGGAFADNGTQSVTGSKRFTGFAHGHADKVIQHSKTRYTLKQATYATGSPYDDDWMLSATTLDLDRNSGLGTAYNTLFYVKDMPILYWPYINFPIDNRRRTGFLYPTAGYNSNAGYFVTTPFYWNIAPNYDFLLTPTVYNHRGILLDGNFRYLTQTQSGNVELEYMPHDRISSSDRKAFSIVDQGTYTRNWSSFLNYQYIGDKDFYNDFDSDDIGLSTQSLLNRQFSVSYANPHFNFNTNIQAYDVIDDTMYLANRPYWMLPALSANYSAPNLLPHVDFNWDNALTYFYKPSIGGISQVTGQRLYSAPTFRFPFSQSWGFLTPSLTMSETFYDLQNRSAVSSSDPLFSQNAFPEKTVNRALPIISVDSGLYFDRSFTLNRHQYSQLLEPRLFYTYIPYQNQSNIPLFDTSLSNFSYSSLFQTNSFTGLDRINNANQLAYALQTSVNDKKSGQSVLSAGIGQMAYFTDRKVSLCSGSNDDCATSHVDFYDAAFSDVAGFFNYRFLPNWQLLTDLTWNPNNSNVDSQNYQLQYMPDSDHIFNVAYQNIKNNYSALTPQQIQQSVLPDPLSQLTFSALWKLTPHWSLAGLWSYAFNSRHTTNMFAGVQYDACTWAIRLLAQRYVNSSSDPNNPSEVTGPLSNAFIFQFELKGLGGSSESSLASRLGMISGYSEGSSFG